MTSSIPRPRRRALALATAALVATGLTACEPPGPPPAFTVEPAATGADAAPGDGVCATAQGACSLPAAVEEANALDRPTEITVPDGAVAEADLTVTGAITLVAGGDYQALNDVSWTIAEGAQVTVTDASLGPIAVDGTLLARRIELGSELGGTGPITDVETLVRIGPSGTALLVNAVAHSWGPSLTVNAGVLSLHASYVSPGRAPGPAAITTEAGGQTRLSATVLQGAATGNVAACAGEAPTSYGSNLSYDTSCGLVLTGDRQDVTDLDSLAPTDPSDPRVDAIPVGTLHCGGGWDDDIRGGGRRPVDGDGDGTAECDIGPYEALILV